MKIWIAFVLCFLASFSASAVTETNKTILSMGVQDTVPGTPRAYVSLSPPLARNCLYGIAYIPDLSIAGGTALYAILQRAYSVSKPLSRVDYDQDSTSGNCFITLIEVSQ